MRVRPHSRIRRGSVRHVPVWREPVLGIAAAALLLAGCGGSGGVHTVTVTTTTTPQQIATDTQTSTDPTTPTPSPTTPTITDPTPTVTQPTATASLGSELVGRWLGPEPGFNQTYCSNGTALYSFQSDGSWAVNLVNTSDCGGTYTLGGTYQTGESTIALHFNYCPETCPADATVNVAFIDDSDFTMSDATFSGTYHRQ